MRVYAPLDDPAVNELDRVAEERGFSRAQLIIKAIDYYLHQPEPSSKELDQLRIKLDQANFEMDQLKLQLDQARIKLEQPSASDAIREELEQLKTKYDQSVSENTKRWEESKSLRNEITKLKKALDEAQATNQRLQADLIKKQSEVDQVVILREQLAVVKNDRDRLEETLKIRNADVEFFKATVHQLNEMLPKQKELPPSEEEAKAKHWWTFWW